MDRNGYNKSILNTEPGICFVCQTQTETARHEIYFGKNRKISKEHGFWVNVCPECHGKIHSNTLNADKDLKEVCQGIYELTHSREDFIELVGRSYL